MFANRPYQSSDLEKLCAFVAQCQRLSAMPSEFLHPSDVVWRILQHTHYRPEQGVQIWEKRAEMVGFVLQKRLDFDCTLAPWLSSGQQKELLEAMLAHAENHARQTADPQGKVITSAAKSNLELIEGLQANGYKQDDHNMYALERSLNEEIPAPRLPTGFVVRHPEPHELQERVDIHREVWNPSGFTLESYQNLRSGPVYRPDLDLVTVSPEGQFASYCIVWYDSLNQIGEFEPVGTREAWQRKGLGKAVLLEGFRRLKALGAKKAFVYCYPDNLEFYQSAGFKEVNQWLGFSKPL